MKEFCEDLIKEAKWFRRSKEVQKAAKKSGLGSILTFPVRLTGVVIRNVGASLAERPITTLLAGGGVYGGYKYLQKKKQEMLGGRSGQSVDYIIPGG